MKINKILAAGIAATLAVTSLSAVASAETKSYTWKMDYTFSKVKWNKMKIAYLDDNSKIKAGDAADATAKVIVFNAANDAKVKTDAFANNADGTKDFIDKDGSATVANAALALPADFKDPTTAMTSANKVIKSALAAAKTASAATLAAADAATTKTGAQVYNDLINLRKQLNTANMAIADLKAAVNATVDSSATAVVKEGVLTAAAAKTITDKLEDYAKQISAAITTLDTAADDAEAALLGDPLLADNEIGGIKLSTKAFDEWSVKDGKTTGRKLKITGAHVDVVGTKRGSTATQTDSKDFQQGYKTWYLDTNGKTTHIGKDKDDFIWIGFTPKWVNREGFINLDVYGAITDIRVTVDYALLDADGNEIEYFTQVDYDNNKKALLENLRYFEKNNLLTYMNEYVTDFDVFFDTYDPAINDYGTKETNGAGNKTKLYMAFTGLDNSVVSGEVTENSDSKKTLKPFLAITTGKDGEGKTIYRENVKVLSYTQDYNSKTINGKTDFNQTYDDAGMGTKPKWFAGLASQAADFFDKQNNGQIIFKFQDPATADKWVSYGVPSTEVGLRTLQGTAMALFFNYMTSTGSIQTIGVVDKDAWTITFDMATVLDDFGTRTKATLEDIYYGLNTGLDYGDPYNGKGYVVETVTFQYDDAPAAVDATTDDDAAVVVADDDDDDVVADDDDDDIFEDDDVVADDDDDDDDAGIIEDDDDDDTDVNNDVDYVDGADDDANPGTGVGLAVIPAIVAAAAAIVSKKRK